ncbi:MAG: DUF1508 domain-containing protein [Acidobacteria bacterium]|nr:MAG: DUF1508 domain-containing protein [Acidobacteriota bacterium]REK03714.1 MAG: DUF1508 domain-containing protein [Acidobacteriota bacterium]
MAGKFEIYKDRAGAFRFRLKASNGENVLASEGYKAKSSAKNGIASVQKNCADAACFETQKTRGGKFKFNLKARNRQVIGTSQSYATEAACRNGIKAIAKAATGAKVDDLTAKS